jgi:hypothetical protein
MKVAVERVGLASLGKMGCLLGAVAAFLPSLLCGVAGLALAGLILRWLESWQEWKLSILGQELARVNLVELLGLQRVLEFLQAATAVSGWTLLLAVLILALAAGLLLAVIIVLCGLVYNLVAAATGGVVLELKSVMPRSAAKPE